MARQEKGSRMRMLPPRVQLRQQDALTGSYPTNVRFSTDGRTGKFSNGYNDLQTIVFTSSSTNISWQNNLVAYWTMQRNIQNNGLIGGIAFQTEKNISNSSEGFLDATQTNNFASSLYSGYGIVEDFPFVGKIYDVNINTITQSNNATIPFFVPNKNYNFKPNFSFFARAQLYSTNRFPALIQYVDSNKSLCAFNGSWDDGPSPFTIAGWFKIDDILSEQNSYDLIHGPNRFSNYILQYAEDYKLSIVDSATPNSKKISLTLYSGSISQTLQTSTVDLNENVFFNNWVHIAATYDGKTNRATPPNPRGTADSNSLKIYLNGERVSTTFLALGNFNGFLSGTLPNYGVSFINLIKGPGTMAATGSIAEAAFFNKELTAQEIYEVYNSRVPLNKKGRILAGTSINVDNNPDPIDSIEYMTTFNRDGMLITGSIVKGVGDNPEWVHFSPGQEPTPFRDDAQAASDGKSTNNSFYATGSLVANVGEGFTSPLWSKNKIEIDITPSAEHSVGITNTTGNDTNFPMMYWNKDLRVWQGVGLGKEFDDYTTDTSLNCLQQLFDDIPIGFGASLDNGAVNSTFASASYILGGPISNYGFPYHPKFYATSSNLISMSDYIDQPFLLEKIVIYASASLDMKNYFASSLTAITTFFLLNQRNENITVEQEVAYYSGSNSERSFVTSSTVPSQYNGNYINSAQDLITYVQLSAIPFAGTAPTAYIKNIRRDYNYVPFEAASGGGGTRHFNTQLVVSGTVKNPIELSESIIINVNDPTTAPAGRGPDYVEKFDASGRKGYRSVNGRDYINSIQDPDNIGTTRINGRWRSFKIIPVSSNITKINPYIMLPTDKIILGWHVPTSQSGLNQFFGGASEIYNGLGPTLTFSISGINKIVLYGSYIKEGREYNDGTNQLLSSDTVHEVIE